MADTQAIVPRDNGRPATVETRETRREEAPALPAEQEIKRTREQISRTTALIQQQVRANLDWHLWVYRYPFATTLIAASAGVLVGLALPGGRRDERFERPESYQRERPVRGSEPTRREKELIRQTGASALLATVLTNVSTMAVREGGRYLVRRFIDGR